MPSRRVTSLVLFTFAVMGERFAYYALRSMAYMFRAAEHDATSFSSIWSYGAVLSALGILIGGGIAFVASPRIAALVGLSLEIVAALLAVVHAPVWAIYLMLPLGAGIFRPSLYVFAGKSFLFQNDEAGVYLPSPRRFAGASAFAILLLGVADLSALGTGTISLANKFGLAVAAICALIPLVVAAVLVGVSLGTDSDRDPLTQGSAIQTAYRTAAPAVKPPELISLTKAFPMVALLCAAIALEYGSESAFPQNFGYSQQWLFTAEPVASILFAAIFGSIFQSASKNDASTIVPARWLGVALVLLAIEKIVTLIAPSMYWPCAIFGSCVDPLLGIGIGYGMAAQRTRFLPFIVAGYLATVVFVPVVMPWMAVNIPFFGWMRVVLLLAAGAIVTAISRQIHAGFEPLGATRAQSPAMNPPLYPQAPVYPQPPFQPPFQPPPR